MKVALGTSTLVEEHVHYWIIDSENVGRCRYCPEVKDFTELLRREGVFVGKRRKKKPKEALI